jgi:DNA-directed RNA polymerase subunit RPC12/RpoP
LDRLVEIIGKVFLLGNLDIMKQNNSQNEPGLNCPICGSKEYEIIFHHARLANIRRTYASKESRKKFIINLNTSLCKYCGFLYRSPLLSEQEQRKYYQSEYYETYKPKKPSEFDADSFYSKENVSKYRRYINFLKDSNIYITNKRVLDVGTGGGYFF